MGKRAAAISAAIRRRITKAAIMLALEILKELKRNTPVDTGHARRNWIGSVGSPNMTERNEDSDQGVAEILAFKLGDGTLWIASVVDYVSYLNYGSSSQRPAGWVEVAIDVAFQKTKAKLEAAGNTDFDIDSLHDEFRSNIGGAGAENLASSYDPFAD